VSGGDAVSRSAPDPSSTADPRAALLGVYAPPPPLFVRGEGPWLIDDSGRRYLDFICGIGVTGLGHDAPEVREAILEALGTGIVHTSNLFRTAPAERLAAELVRASFPGRVFFCNSGGEAGEAALKITRKWAKRGGGEAKHEFLAFHGGFHGRLFGTLATTDNPAYREPFEPLMPGVRFLDVGDEAALERAMDPVRVAAVVIEPIQGEGGIRPVPHAFLRTLRRLCDERGVALVFDEVQCGMGRSGRLFAHEWAGVQPDVLTLAKPLAGGLPMGAVIVGEPLAQAMAPGDHGTTFGGGPLLATVARRVLATISAPDFLAGVRERGARLEADLRGLASRSARVREVRGAGLMWGVEIDGPAAEVVARAREGGLLLAVAGKQVVRLLPPLAIDPELLARGVEILEEALA
jgi:predicted acetylornithine/succinylornithine family transaminase